MNGYVLPDVASDGQLTKLDIEHALKRAIQAQVRARDTRRVAAESRRRAAALRDRSARQVAMVEQQARHRFQRLLDR